MTFTKERIIEELKASTQNASGMFEINEDTICALMELLESRADADQHIRREVNVGGNTWVQCSNAAFEKAKSEGKHVRELYERPQPAPVVPDDVPEWLKDRLLTICDVVDDNDEYCQDIWNACRAAMLQGGK